MGPDGGFITGSDILIDGGVTAAYWYGDLAEVRVPRSDQAAARPMSHSAVAASE